MKDERGWRARGRPTARLRGVAAGWYGRVRTGTDRYGRVENTTGLTLAHTRAADKSTNENRTYRTKRTNRTMWRVTRLRQGYGAASHDQRLFAVRA